MIELKLRFAKPEESKQIVEWLNGSTRNDFDSDILTYPTLRVLCSYNHKPVAYLPTQTVLMLESMAKNPDAEPLQYAQALRDLVKGAEVVASADGIQEIWMASSDDTVVKMAQSRGFEVIHCRVLRLKL